MGVFITLKINPKEIDADRWRTVFLQTRQLLDAYPGGLVSMKTVPYKRGRRLMLTRDLIREDYDGRYWTVSGDMDAKKIADNFVLHERLDSYLKEAPAGECVDILKTCIDEDTPDSVVVFCAKTQGHPYHLAILAAAMWVEHCFPQHALVKGDIDPAQCRRAAEYIDDSLGEDVALPLVVSPDRLMTRVSAFSSGFDRLNYFGKALQGGGSVGLAALESLLPREEFEAWFIHLTDQFRSGSRTALVSMMMDWLNAELDLEDLLRLFCIVPEKKHFEPPIIAAALADTWIAIPKTKRETMDAFTIPEGYAETAYSQFGGFLLDMGGMQGRNMKKHLTTNEIFDVFTNLFPQQANAMEAAFHEAQERILERLAQLKKPVDHMMDRFHEDAPPITDGMELMGMPLSDFTPEYHRQCDMMADTIRTWRKEMTAHPKSPDPLDVSREELLEFISFASGDGQIMLTEDTWARFDEETDTNILLGAAAMMNNADRTQTFCNVRWAILESESLLEHVVNRSYEDFELEEEEDEDEQEAFPLNFGW